jgi:hypothetical protein
MMHGPLHKTIDAQSAERLTLVKLLAANKLTRNQRRYLVDELLRFWFPKEWAAQGREFDHQEMADMGRLMIRLAAAKTGSVADAKREVTKQLGLQSIEALDKRIKRARRAARRYGMSALDNIAAVEQRIHERDKKPKKFWSLPHWQFVWCVGVTTTKGDAKCFSMTIGPTNSGTCKTPDWFATAPISKASRNSAFHLDGC